MKLTREKALNLHRRMWMDIQKVLGDNPIPAKRVQFKEKWCMEHFPKDQIRNNCFLCEYTLGNGRGCSKCPIIWPTDACYEDRYYYRVPISEILALPEREVTE